MAAKLAVIGAGAKAAAIAAKAECLNHAGLADIEVTLFDRAGPAANWSGANGYTDGGQPLCTPAERDVGFPYAGGGAFEPVKARMQAEYSWMAYAVRNENLSFSDWVNRGGTRPTHGVFADYLRYVIDRSGALREDGMEVTALARRARQWTVVAHPVAGGPSRRLGSYDAVVATGPGPARSTFGTFSDPALFNGENVWLRLPELLDLLERSGEAVVIVGAGGAAAAIAAWLIANGQRDRPIAFIAEQATFYTRSERYFENQVFDNDQLWADLGKKEQKEFVDRLTRGVVWDAVADRLMDAKALVMVPGRATRIAVTPTFPGEARSLSVYFKRPGRTEPGEIEGCVVIDAAGFNPWWFAGLLPGKWKTKSEGSLKKAAEAMDPALRFPLGSLPPLHTPGVAQAVGPGYGSLMVLGTLADRILEPYIR